MCEHIASETVNTDKLIITYSAFSNIDMEDYRLKLSFTATGKQTVEGVQKKISSIIEKLGVPIQVFVSIGRGHYRKPGIGMWEFLQKKVSMTRESVVVGTK